MYAKSLEMRHFHVPADPEEPGVAPSWAAKAAREEKDRQILSKDVKCPVIGCTIDGGQEAKEEILAYFFPPGGQDGTPRVNTNQRSLSMKRLMATLFMIALCAGALLAQTQTKAAAAKKTAAPANPVADELRQIENDWIDAIKTKNVDKVADTLADGSVGLDWDGKRFDKAKRLADMKSGAFSLDTCEVGRMTVRIFGNTAVVIGSDTEKSTENGKDTSGEYVWMDVFVKQNGKWRAVASETTKVLK